MKISHNSTATTSTHICFVLKDGASTIQDFEGKKGQISVRYDNQNTVIYCGCGEKKSCTADVIRSSAASGIREAIELKRDTISVVGSAIESLGAETGQTGLVSAVVEGTLLGTYSFSRYKSEKPHEIGHAEFVAASLTPELLEEIDSVTQAVFFARDLVNENAHVINPAGLSKEAQKIAKKHSSVKCTILAEKEIETHKLGLLKAVGQGSETPSRLIILEYHGNPSSKEVVGLVGKGLTFDCGGYNLKPSGHIETMSSDMAGAAAVLGAVKVAVDRALRVNIVAVIPAAHNALDGSSYFPGDIYTAYSGTTVEINNTDAEGRLILADALSYCVKNYAPTEVIDLATLTGSILSSFGDHIAGLFSNDDNLATRLADAAEKTGEKVWRLPLTEYYIESMKGDRSDLRNLSKLPRTHAGAICGAAFLSHFIEEKPWAHFDIAGTAYNERDARGEIPKYGTGYGVRLLYRFLKEKSSKQ